MISFPLEKFYFTRCCFVIETQGCLLQFSDESIEFFKLEHVLQLKVSTELLIIAIDENCHFTL